MMMSPSRRPPLVQVEMTSPNGIPKLRVNKYRCFLEVMGGWYKKDLSRKEKKHLTTKRFKRRALLELERLQYEYNSLPQDWVSVLVDKYGVKLNEKRRKPKAPPPPPTQANTPTQPGRSNETLNLNQMLQNAASANAEQFDSGYTHKLMQRGGLERLRRPPAPQNHDHITLSWILDRPEGKNYPQYLQHGHVQSRLRMQPQFDNGGRNSQNQTYSSSSEDSDESNTVDEGPMQVDTDTN